jgi:hypothetical protein
MLIEADDTSTGLVFDSQTLDLADFSDGKT